jgi:hypothetical protein
MYHTEVLIAQVRAVDGFPVATAKEAVEINPAGWAFTPPTALKPGPGPGQAGGMIVVLVVLRPLLARPGRPVLRTYRTLCICERAL